MQKQAKCGGVCRRHGAKKKLCRSEGCTNQAQNGGVCIKHGAKIKRCSSEGCTNSVVKGGVCAKHGAKVKDAAVRYVQTKFREVACVLSMGQRRNDAVAKDVQI